MKYGLISLGVIVIGVTTYYGIDFYKFGKGVMEDAERMKNFKFPDTIRINDSVSMILTEPKRIDSKTIVTRGGDTIRLD